MRERQASRRGEWLELELEQFGAGSHPHQLRQWLLARSMFPAKWINRLFSIGGIRLREGRIQLLAFPAVKPAEDELYRAAMRMELEHAVPVLYEDDYCLVLHKPAGMPVHSSYAGQFGTLDQAAARHLLNVGDPLAVKHIHRLDDDTSGPVLYAKNDLAQFRLDEAMREKRIERIYLAVVEGYVSKKAGVVDQPIGKDRHHAKRRRVSPNGEKALTRFEKLAANDQWSLLRLRLETGRTHQIRVHMSYIGHPLAGDVLYGGADRALQHQALHGETLLFSHPLHGDKIVVEAPRPSWLHAFAKRIEER
ncbi:RluA family pseudouridine synthase [Paenibacillus sp. HB172176]|uniref:RluA family pseudouridine synthase n=1 Tax=Paenibacillus sp. HB172176 TaxID=2493690 RepID=UPI00143C76C0|nr:RluA family pseudouridine synthase [Paenibacillus sp. HB172176]